jgi:hypothetical protein
MFHFSTAAVIEGLEQSVASVQDITPYIKGCVGDISSNVINRLFSSYANRNGSRSVCIVSNWAASRLALQAGPELVRRLANITRPGTNPGMDGCLFEMWVFSLLNHLLVTPQAFAHSSSMQE